MLINFEGLDGVGKSTLVEAVSRNIPGAVLTKEPGSHLVGINAQIRSMVLENANLTPIERELLFYVDASVHRRALADLRADRCVLCDRGIFSHYAYLRGYLKTKQIDFDQYSLCKRLIEEYCAKPEIVVYLKGSLELMRIRTAGKKKDVIESNSPVFYSHVLETYEDLVSNCPYKLLVLDASERLDNNIERVLSFLQEEGYESTIDEYDYRD